MLSAIINFRQALHTNEIVRQQALKYYSTKLKSQIFSKFLNIYFFTK